MRCPFCAAGLEVILEEPEEDYCSSPVNGEDYNGDYCSSPVNGENYNGDSDLRLRLKTGERGSLDGSEGIGSAEGDSSGGGSDHYPEEEEEDCASSGIHSQGLKQTLFVLFLCQRNKFIEHHIFHIFSKMLFSYLIFCM